eukprot:TRINITY_DN6906_c0_g2_i1.p1 TRINITY_DN6906_c0_g2~~TRINITY_DN6906_c0_g2_i1.p1  ORF type:complete len:412 (+),score=56.21 TRINITY_DN6906_c0_g2_i1:145-1236(+)
MEGKQYFDLECGDNVASLTGKPITEVRSSDVIDGRQATIIPAVIDGKHVVVKRVSNSHAIQKPEGVVRDTFVGSARREIDFYKNHVDKTKAMWPECHLAVELPCEGQHPEFVLILENFTASGYDQHPQLTHNRMLSAIECLADFHAAYWNDSASLKELPGSFWVLPTRHESETNINAVEKHWESLCKFNDNFDPTVGPRIANNAHSIDSKARSISITRVHGDAKGPNMFFKDITDDKSECRLIDAQWTGSGNPLSDVANIITAGIHIDRLDDFDNYFEHYNNYLQSRLSPDHLPTYLQHVLPTWDYCWLDYARVVILGLWQGMNNDKFARNQNNVGSSMVGKSKPHMEFLVRRADAKMKENGW